MKHYEQTKQHRGYPLGGGVIHPGAETHNESATETLQLLAALNQLGLRGDYEHLLGEVRRTRGELLQQNVLAPDPRWDHYDELRDKLDDIVATALARETT